jgi:hypothetical protein
MLAVLPLAISVWAQRGSRGAARSSVSRSSSANVNRNVSRDVNANRSVNRDVDRNVNANRSVNRNIDVDRDIDVDVDRRYGVGNGCCYHPVARTAAAVTTAAVIGSMVYSLPSSCSEVSVDGGDVSAVRIGVVPAAVLRIERHLHRRQSTQIARARIQRPSRSGLLNEVLRPYFVLDRTIVRSLLLTFASYILLLTFT